MSLSLMATMGLTRLLFVQFYVLELLSKEIFYYPQDLENWLRAFAYYQTYRYPDIPVQHLVIGDGFEPPSHRYSFASYGNSDTF